MKKPIIAITLLMLGLGLASAQVRFTDCPMWLRFFGNGGDGTLVSNTTMNEQGENEYTSTGASGTTPGVSVNLQSSSVVTITSVNTGNKPAGSWIILAWGSCTFAGTINSNSVTSATTGNLGTASGGGSGAGGGFGAANGSNGSNGVLPGGTGPAGQQQMAAAGAGGTSGIAGAAGATPAANSLRALLNNNPIGFPALGGAAGGAGGSSGGSGGAGGAAFIAACLGGITFTGTINVTGGAGGAGGANTGGGGGGGGGMVILAGPTVTNSRDYHSGGRRGRSNRHRHFDGGRRRRQRTEQGLYALAVVMPDAIAIVEQITFLLDGLTEQIGEVCPPDGVICGALPLLRVLRPRIANVSTLSDNQLKLLVS
ncbi:MAG TPA: hypothetical protein VKS22_16300 [Candidatus Binataceae bacterium]|nr:hypothetical protein [Candidatus Binataceae bacterium]